MYCLNSAARTQSRDKLYSLQLLLNSGIGIPTGFASPLDTNDLIKMVGVLIVKLLEGTRRVVLAGNKKSSRGVLLTHSKLKC
jgi:ribosomal protein S6--L-glutamate ligase